MIILKIFEEIELMCESVLVVFKILGMFVKEVKLGVIINYFDKIVEEYIREE